MKKVLVVSDSHRNDMIVHSLLEEYRDQVDLMVHCGDSETSPNELKKIAPFPVYIAAGNCDYNFVGDPEPMFEFEGHTCLVVHGHKQFVNWGTDELADYAKELGADIVFYGHTHKPDYQEYRNDEIIVMNPGSVSEPRQFNLVRTFMIVDFNDDGTVEPHLYSV